MASPKVIDENAIFMDGMEYFICALIMEGVKKIYFEKSPTLYQITLIGTFVMSDFTKEELEDLNYGICHLISIGSCDSTWNADMRTLKNKLEIMIDNYCEHESKCNHDWSVGFGSIYSPVIYCKMCKCQKPELPIDVFKKVMGINKEEDEE